MPWGKQQPSHDAVLDWSNPLLRGATFVAIFNGGAPRNLVGQTTAKDKFLTPGGTPTQTVNVYGRNTNFPTATDFWDCGPSNVLVNTTKCTVAMIKRKTDATNRDQNSFTTENSPDRCMASVPWSDGVVYWDFGTSTVGSGRINSAAQTGLEVAEPWVFHAGDGALRAGADTRAIWRNGIKIANSTTDVTTISPSVDTFEINQGTGLGTTDGDLQEINLFIILQRQWEDREIKAWSYDPYQIFMPPKPTWVPRGTGTVAGAATTTGGTVWGEDSFRAYDGNHAPKLPYEINKDSPQAFGLQAWYPFFGEPPRVIDGGPTYVVPDKAGIHNNPLHTFSSSTFSDTVTDGDFNSTVGDLDGTTAAMHWQADQLPFMDTTNGEPISFSCWCLPRTMSTRGGVMGIDSNDFQGVSLYFEVSTARFHWSHGLWNGGVNDATASRPLNVWYHVVGTSTGHTGTLKLYVNGVQDGSDATGDTVSNAAALSIGSLTVTGGRAWDGRIADARIYNRALSPNEILAMYIPQTRWDLYRDTSQRKVVAVPGAAPPPAGGGEPRFMYHHRHHNRAA